MLQEGTVGETGSVCKQGKCALHPGPSFCPAHPKVTVWQASPQAFFLLLLPCGLCLPSPFTLYLRLSISRPSLPVVPPQKAWCCPPAGSLCTGCYGGIQGVVATKDTQAEWFVRSLAVGVPSDKIFFVLAWFLVFGLKQGFTMQCGRPWICLYSPG